MKIRYLVLAIIGAMVLSLGAVACGDDDGDGNGNGNGNGGELTLADYFSELEPLSQTFDAGLNALNQGESLDEFVSFVEGSRSLVDDFVGDLDGLDAPAEVEEAHSEAVAAGQALVDMYDNAITVFDTVETVEDARLVLQGPGFVDARVRFAASCVALQGFADSNGLDIDMACPAIG